MPVDVVDDSIGESSCGGLAAIGIYTRQRPRDFGGPRLLTVSQSHISAVSEIVSQASIAHVSQANKV